MPTLTSTMAPSSAAVTVWDQSRPLESHYNGPEAGRIAQLIEDVVAHWSARAEKLIESEAMCREGGYSHVPLKPRFAVQVRYKSVGRLHPRQIEFDD